MIREKSNAREFGRKRSRLLLAGTAVFTPAAQWNHLGNKTIPKAQVHPDQPLRTVPGKDREEKVLVLRPEGWVVV